MRRHKFTPKQCRKGGRTVAAMPGGTCPRCGKHYSTRLALIGHGNDHAPQSKSPLDTWVELPSSATWKAFCSGVGASSELVNSIFGEAGVSSWMRAKPENSAKAAAQMVLDALAQEQF